MIDNPYEKPTTDLIKFTFNDSVPSVENYLRSLAEKNGYKLSYKPIQSLLFSTKMWVLIIDPNTEVGVNYRKLDDYDTYGKYVRTHFAIINKKSLSHKDLFFSFNNIQF